MDLDVVFLGTSASAPTARRAPSALLVRRGGERLLFDCAEGTQRQLLRSSIGLVELDEVFLTHYHADHYLGLPGMMKTFALRGRETPMTIYGPPGLADLFGSLRRVFGKLTYPYELVELEPGETLDRDDYRLETIPVDHEATAVGYALVELPRPGRFDVEKATALGVPAGPLFGALQAGEKVTLPDGDDGRSGPGARPAAPGKARGHERRHPSGPQRARGGARGRAARPRGELRLRGARPCGRDGALDRARGGRAGARRRREAPRPHAPVEPLLRPRARPRGARRLPRDSGAQGLRYDRDSVRRTRRAGARQGRRTRTPGGGSPRWTWCK